MRRVLYIMVLALLLPMQVERRDVGDMLPVESVMIYTRAETVVIRTDTGNQGTGSDLLEAARDLKTGASKQIFLDTAQYLILAGDYIPSEDLGTLFKGRVYVCRGSGGMNLEEVTKYLSVHAPKYRLRDAAEGVNLQEIRITANGYALS